MKSRRETETDLNVTATEVGEGWSGSADPTSVPIILLLGLAGVGKTKVATWLRDDMGFLHLDCDRVDGRDGLKVSGVRDEWRMFLLRSDATSLASVIRTSVSTLAAAGAVLSFPSTTILSRGKIESAAKAGVTTVILYGPPRLCLRAFLERESRMGRGFDVEHWHRHNDRAAVIYARRAYADVRVSAFQTSGDRWPREVIFTSLTGRVAHTWRTAKTQ